jgi:DNA-binding NarL/FixJ family response regulator
MPQVPVSNRRTDCIAEGASLEEIAAALGMGRSTVDMAIRRALRRLWQMQVRRDIAVRQERKAGRQRAATTRKGVQA